MLMYIWTMIRWKSHVEKLHVSRFTGPKRLQMAKIETFCDISWNVEIRPIWFSELRTVVIVASICWKPYVFKVFHFRVIHWPRGPKGSKKRQNEGKKVFFFLHFLFIFAFCPKQHMYFDSLNSFNFILRPWEPFWAKLAIFEKFLPDPLSQSKMST